MQIEIKDQIAERVLPLLPPETTLEKIITVLLAQWIQQESARRLQAELTKELGLG